MEPIKQKSRRLHFWLCLAFCLAFLLKDAFPQSPVTVTVGAGTNFTGWPYYTYWMCSRTQMLYTAAEISAAGGSAGQIIALGFNVSNSYSTQTMINFTIKMKNTNATSCTGWDDNDITTVYQTNYAVPGPGWQMITMITPFYYNGSNLLVEICFGDDGTYTANSIVYASSIPGMTYHTHSDFCTGCLLSAGTVQPLRPNLRFVEQIVTLPNQKVYYVSNGGIWNNNWDLYSYDMGAGLESRLTFNAAIDNHPDISHIDPNRVVFSSNRGNGEFDIYVANVNDVDNTAVRLTNDSYQGTSSQGAYPDRHPHWHPNGNLIIFTAKNRPIAVYDNPPIVTICSEPVITFHYNYYEGMNVIELDESNNILSYTPLDVATAWDPAGYPGIWRSDQAVYVGHPSFNQEGNKIVFTAAIDGEGKNWEVYTAGFHPASKSLIPNSLRRVTFGPNNIFNPIKLTGGAKFNNDDTQILFNSTRVTGGNSLIYSVPATSIDVPVTNATPVTSHMGNDYVPQPVPGTDAILITSDLGDTNMRICITCVTTKLPSDDFDLVLLQGNTRTIVGTDAFQEMLFIPDEVSWFCGSKPNLSSCTFHPRIFSVESLWLEHNSDYLPSYLLDGYGPCYHDKAIQLYSYGWMNLMQKLYMLAPVMLDSIMQDIMMLNYGFPGWNDTTALSQWLESTKQLRMKKWVVPAVMDTIGLASSKPYKYSLNEMTIPNLCNVTYEAFQTISAGGNNSSFKVESGGNVILNAGQKISLLPNTWMKSGCNVNVKVSPFEEKCPNWLSGSPKLANLQDDQDKSLPVRKCFFKVYPNPTSQDFWIELLDNDDPRVIQVEVFDFTGKKVIVRLVPIVKRTLLSFSNQSPGIYMVRVESGNHSGGQKLILGR